MSLLLEALKKAALEKQSRTESSPPPLQAPVPEPEPTLAADTADEAIREVIDQNFEAFEPVVNVAVETKTVSEPTPAPLPEINADEFEPVEIAPTETETDAEGFYSFNDTLDQEDDVEPVELDQKDDQIEGHIEAEGLTDDWDAMEELDLDEEAVKNFDDEPPRNEPEPEHGVHQARLQQEALQLKQKDEKEKARALAEIDRQQANDASIQLEERNRQSLDQLIASGKAVVRRSKRRSAFLYAMLVMTALGGILSYYFYLLANSGIAELQQPQVTESSIDIAEIIEATELEALEVAQASGATEQPLDTTENAALQGRIDKNGQTASTGGALATRSEPNVLQDAMLQGEPTSRIAAQRDDSPLAGADYLNPLNLTDESASQPSGVAKRVIIHHTQSSRGLSDIVQNAYGALQRRELQKAANLYDQALAIDSNQRDALLGAAATATALRRFDDAANYYQRRLNADPKDSFARAGLLALMNDGKSRAAVQREVATLLAQNPNSSHLHFLKGVGFASEGRWKQAQSAFYEAYRLDNNNPDYAFNLAVSLDHLGQPPLARVYYERALNLAQIRTANFDIAAIQQRLLELSQP